MKDSDALAPVHIAEAFLIEAIDDELPVEATAVLEAHLSVCESCRRRYQSLRQLSNDIESAVAALPLQASGEQRARLERDLDWTETVVRTPRLLPRLAWTAAGAMAVAAALAFAVLVAPQWKRSVESPAPRAAIQPSVFEVDGERFVALPYSNPDLPLNESHVVEMQVPVSSLADAGIVFEPISNEMSAPDRSVLADVLLGMDGRPLGIHVLNAE
jgi:anti-sigma factor RsiW